LDKKGVKRRFYINNGANDDASGTTAVAEMAKLSIAKTTSSILLCFFLQEKKRKLLGSKHLVKKLKAQDFKLYAHNIEMIGVPMKVAYITGFDKSNMADKINEYTGKTIGFLQRSRI
jgi:Zn-dependent M28 family amino/carboxypeptidase